MIQRHPSVPARRRRSVALTATALSLALVLQPLAYAQAPAQNQTAKSRSQVTLNFVNADIEAVSRAIGAMLDRQVLVDPRVKGNITLYSEQPLTPREAYLNYLAALRGLGFTIVEAGGLLKVVPEADAKLQTGTVSVGAVTNRGDQVMTQIFRLQHENANNLVAVLRPLISPNNTINANPSNNTLVITDYADNLKRLEKIIAAMDTASDVEVIPLRHAVAADLAPLVQRLSDSAPGAPAPGGAAALSIMVDSRSNALIVRAPSAARMAAVKSLVDKLDRATLGANGDTGNIYVVYLKNADAVKLASVLRAAYTPSGAGAAGSPAQVTPTTAAGVTPTGAAGALTPATTPVSASQGPSTGGFIQADPSTNSLIITAPEPVYRQLRAVIDQLDSRRAQIYIESMIVKVDATKAAEFGFQWNAVSGNRGDKYISGAGTNFPGSDNIISLSAAAAQGRTGLAAVAQNPPSGFNLGVLRNIGGFYTLAALARFLETNADGNVLSTPNLVSLDNEEAKIVIGQNVPFITGQFTNTGAAGGATNPFQTIERKDVGLTLRVKPQIGEGGTVRMTIYQENSNVVAGASSAAGPTTDKSSIETTVVIDDGQIMVLGGLLKDEFSGGTDKVPVLGDIPLVGNLFRSDNRARTKTNLMVFLRPVVIRTQQAADALTLDRYDAIRALQRDSQPAPSVILPINQSPVLPPMRDPAAGPAAPLPVPSTSAQPVQPPPPGAPPPPPALPPGATPQPVQPPAPPSAPTN
jgi:general secretion pathway protein D